MVVRFIFPIPHPLGTKLSLYMWIQTKETHGIGNTVVEVKEVLVHKVFVTVDFNVNSQRQRLRLVKHHRALADN